MLRTRSASKIKKQWRTCYKSTFFKSALPNESVQNHEHQKQFHVNICKNWIAY